jgi:hypothetical protein
VLDGLGTCGLQPSGAYDFHTLCAHYAAEKLHQLSDERLVGAERRWCAADGMYHLRHISMATGIMNWLIFTYVFEIGYP